MRVANAGPCARRLEHVENVTRDQVSMEQSFQVYYVILELVADDARVSYDAATLSQSQPHCEFLNTLSLSQSWSVETHPSPFVLDVAVKSI